MNPRNPLRQQAMRLLTRTGPLNLSAKLRRASGRVMAFRFDTVPGGDTETPLAAD